MQQRRICIRVEPRIGRELCHRDVARRRDECTEVCVGHGHFVDPEIVDGHATRGGFFRIVLVRTHPVRPPGDMTHPLQKFLRRLTDHSRGGAGWPVTTWMAGPRNVF